MAVETVDRTIPDRSVVTYTGHWPNPGLLDSLLNSADEYIAGVKKILTGRGLIVLRSRTKSSLLGGIPFAGIDVELQIEVRNGFGFTDPDQIVKLIDDAVEQFGGERPTSGSIVIVQKPGARPVETGQPRTEIGGEGGGAGFLEGLTTKAALAVGFIGLGILVVFAVFLAIPER